MNFIERVQTYTDNIDFKEKMSDVIAGAKTYANRASAALRAVSRIDMAVMAAVAAAIGGLITSLFTKVSKKVIIALAIVCGLGGLYFVWKKYFKD